MINILVKVKNVMNKILSAASVVYDFVSIMAGVYKICAWQTSSIYRRTC